MFPEVEVYRYVTEQTFDAYLYQLVESKQKFISQIMTSKSPVRSAEDVDEVALSFAEVKMLATGDARFKEKMDLDIQVSKLRVLKQSYLSEHYELEDRVLKYYPQTIKEYEKRIAGYENDAALAEQHKPQGEDKFCPMTLKGVTYTEKAAAGEMLLAICKDYPMSGGHDNGSSSIFLFVFVRKITSSGMQSPLYISLFLYYRFIHIKMQIFYKKHRAPLYMATVPYINKKILLSFVADN